MAKQETLQHSYNYCIQHGRQSSVWSLWVLSGTHRVGEGACNYVENELIASSLDFSQLHTVAKKSGKPWNEAMKFMYMY